MLYELSNVALRYGKQHALSINSLRIGWGERVAILGPNGSGKSSLLKLLDGLVRPNEGQILMDGKGISKGNSGIRSVYLHQYPYLLAGSVAYNVAFGCRAKGFSRTETKARVKDAFSLLRLDGLERRSGSALSGGESQRVALARAFASGAEILLLDEPSASADTASTDVIMDALRHTSGKGATIIFSTHDEQFADKLCCRTVRLREGKIVEGGDA